MKCPIDTTVDLVMADRSGIEIDYCPTCRGVWLDRGELDKIIERNATATAPVAAPVAPMAAGAPLPANFSEKPRRWDDDDDDDDRRRYSSDDPRYRKKKKSSLLGELFDF
jgi:Zn-finger nucleic acid-binding protein